MDAKYLLLRAELRHLVNNLENYVMTQIHASANAAAPATFQHATTLDQVGGPPRLSPNGVRARRLCGLACGAA